MTVALERRGSAHHEVNDATATGRYEGVMMAVRALRAKAEDERQFGRLGGAFAVSAAYLEAALKATVEAI
jgi:hypothetical protein